MNLCVAFDYGGRTEMVRAVRHIVASGVAPHEVTEDLIRENLYLPEVPDPDLIIRTAGEQRLSNFLIWQAAYSEYYQTPDAYWPDFDDVEVERALNEYKRRRRRFGRPARRGLMSAHPRSELRLRVASAAAGLPLLFLVLWAGGLVFAAVAVVAALIALREMLDLLRRARTIRGGGPVVLDGVRVLAGVACVALPFAALIALRLDDAGLQWTALAFLVTFATDTSAYAVGRTVGRRKLAPSISPGKTWEGAVGGLVGAAAAAAALVVLLDGIESRLLSAVALGLGIGIVAQAGDLMESKVKRMADAKDSGRLIPGHGGLFGPVGQSSSGVSARLLFLVDMVKQMKWRRCGTERVDGTSPGGSCGMRGKR